MTVLKLQLFIWFRSQRKEAKQKCTAHTQTEASSSTIRGSRGDHSSCLSPKSLDLRPGHITSIVSEGPPPWKDFWGHSESEISNGVKQVHSCVTSPVNYAPETWGVKSRNGATQSTFSMERGVEGEWESEPNKDKDKVDKPGTAQVTDVHSTACDSQPASMTSEVIP